jgi:hypothetical protein
MPQQAISLLILMETLPADWQAWMATITGQIQPAPEIKP